MRDSEDVKSSWNVDAGGDASLVHEITMSDPLSQPCNCQCPWLVDNHGKAVKLFYDHEVPGIAMPQGRFTFAPWKRSDIWNEHLRDGVDGYGSLCHIRRQGTQLREDGGWDIVSRQCTGSVVMQQREVLRHVEVGESALSPEGVARVAGEMLGREISAHELRNLDLRELLEHAHPSLLDPRIGSDAVTPALSERELRGWAELKRLHATRMIHEGQSD